MLAVLPLVWFSAQGFRRWSSKIKASICLSISSSLAIYFSYLSVIPVTLFFLYVVWMQPGRIKQNLKYLILSGLITVLFLLPELNNMLNLVIVRSDIGHKRFIMEPLISAESKVFRIWFAHGGSFRRNGNWLYLLLVIFGISGFYWKRSISRYALFLAFFSIGLLPLLNIFNPILGIYDQFTYSWILLGISASIGYMLANLPVSVRWFATSILLLTFFISQPQNTFSHQAARTSLFQTMKWLTNNWQANDEIMIAQSESCMPLRNNPERAEPIEYWNELLRIYFPFGIPLSEHATANRIWVLSSDGLPDSAHLGLSEAKYIVSQRHITKDCHLQLFETAPDPLGIPFDNGLRYHGAQFLLDGKPLPPGFKPQLHEGEDFGVRIWWTVDSPISAPHRSGFIIRDADGAQLLAEYDVPQLTQPADATHDFRSWQPGQVYFEERKLKLPYPLKRQDIELSLVLIAEADGTIISAPNVDDHGYLPLFRIRVDSW